MGDKAAARSTKTAGKSTDVSPREAASKSHAAPSSTARAAASLGDNRGWSKQQHKNEG
jgi:hypothetical protein